MKVLLVEPGYKAKYPPLGLMKISTYHKQRGDEVCFYKGTSSILRDRGWDIIYITSMFTFKWKTTIDTIKFYQREKHKGAKIIVGGILGSLLQKEVEQETGIKPHFGLWDDVDHMKPDYYLDGMEGYYTNNASFGYTTKGCTNRCQFCAVHKLEPEFVPFISLKHKVDAKKKDLVLLDNNVLASPDFPKIIQEIKKYGFGKGERFGASYRYVDFNQGVDARLLDKENMRLLSEIALKPLRIAFDNIKMEEMYEQKVRLAHKYGIRQLSNYILFNFNDGPEDFYNRLQINIRLNEELKLDIFSFPMKYVPLDAKDRKYIGPQWTQRQLRGIQCILHATHGVVGPKRPFFEKAFGKDEKEFKYIIEQPEESILHRGNMIPYQPEARTARLLCTSVH